MPYYDGGKNTTWYLVRGTDASQTETETECSHASLTSLGADGGNNEYYRCEDCKNVLIETGTLDFRKERTELEKRLERQRRGKPAHESDVLRHVRRRWIRPGR